MTKENADQKNKIQELKTKLQEILDKLKQEKQKVSWLESQMKWRRVLFISRLTLSSPAGATLSISHRTHRRPHRSGRKCAVNDGKTMALRPHVLNTCRTRDAASSEAPLKEAGSTQSVFIALRIVL